MKKQVFKLGFLVFIFFVLNFFITKTVNAQVCSVSKAQCEASATNGGYCTYTCQYLNTYECKGACYWCQPHCASGYTEGDCPAGKICDIKSITCSVCGNVTAKCYKVIQPTATPVPPTNTPIPPPKLPVCDVSSGTCGCKENCRNGANTDYSCCHRDCITNACRTVHNANEQLNIENNSLCAQPEEGKYCGPTPTAVPSPTAPPMSTATPIPTSTPVPTNTPVPTGIQQPAIEITHGPTPTTNPNRTSSSGAKLAQAWVCLKSEPCYQNSNCSGKGRTDHRVRLTSKDLSKPLGNKQTYIFECLQRGGESICTTGNSSSDVKAIGVDNTARVLGSPYLYKFTGIYASNGVTSASNPTTSGADGSIGPFEWESQTGEQVSRTFMAMNEVDARDLVGNGLGDQIGTFDLESADKKCISIKWDPYGRVFDSYTLEPLQNVNVMLSQKSDAGKFEIVHPNAFIGGIINPQKTKEDGSFNFLTPAGVYKIQATLPNYTFLTTGKNLNSNYAGIYSDIYRGGEINQKNEAKHIDIPLDPIDINKSVSYAKSNPISIISRFQNFDNKQNEYSIEGIVSHPLSIIKVYGKRIVDGNQFEKTRVLGSTIADNVGNFVVKVNAKNLNTGEQIGELEAIKNLPTVQAKKPENIFIKIFNFFLFATSTHADTSNSVQVKVDPILDKLSGYARDIRGNAVPNANVGIYMTFSEKPVIEAQADNTGYFSIPSNYLPSISYKIKYTSPNGPTRTLTTSEFMSENK